METLRFIGAIWHSFVDVVCLIGTIVRLLIFYAIGIWFAVTGWQFLNDPTAPLYELKGYGLLVFGSIWLLCLTIDVLNALPRGPGNLHGSSRFANPRDLRRSGILKDD